MISQTERHTRCLMIIAQSLCLKVTASPERETAGLQHARHQGHRTRQGCASCSAFVFKTNTHPARTQLLQSAAETKGMYMCTAIIMYATSFIKDDVYTNINRGIHTLTLTLVRIHVRMHASKCGHKHTLMYTDPYKHKRNTCTHVHIHMHEEMHACMHARMHVCIDELMYVCVCVWMDACTYVCV